jgi:hypothetical protein
MKPDDFVELVGSQWHDSMKGPLEQLFNVKPRESKLTITKAQRSLRDEDNRRIFAARIKEAKELIQYLYETVISPAIYEKLKEAHVKLVEAEELHNAQVRD